MKQFFLIESKVKILISYIKIGILKQVNLNKKKDRHFLKNLEFYAVKL